MGSSKKSKSKDGERKKKSKRSKTSRSRSRERKSKKDKKSRSRSRSPIKSVNKYEDESVSRSRKEYQASVSPPPANIEGGASLTLSIADTNALRAKLGLKPLDFEKKPDPDKESLKDPVHKPAENILDKKKTEALRERMEQTKEKRRMKSKLTKVKGLADSDSDDDASNWVKKMNKKDLERKKAEERLKLMDQMDEEFGITDMVEKEFKQQVKTPAYSSKDLRGLKVAHDQNRFREGATTILTLADKNVLDEDGDELINVNIQDFERTETNLLNKKSKPGYQAYKDEENEFGMMKAREVLDKYDEEISGKKRETFELGSRGTYDASHEKRMAQIKAELNSAAQNLGMPAALLQSDFMTHEEQDAKFKKRKKRVRKVKKSEMVKADDLLPLEGEANEKPRRSGVEDAAFSSDLMSQITSGEKPALNDEDFSDIRLDDEADNDYQFALTLQRKKNQKKTLHPKIAAGSLLDSVGREQSQDSHADESLKEDEIDGLQITATDEFCRNLGSVATYGVSGNRTTAPADELMDFEQDLVSTYVDDENSEKRGWEQVDDSQLNIERPAIENTQSVEFTLADEEVVLDGGIASALKLATHKGFMDREITKIGGRTVSDTSKLLAKNYSIEDKRHDDIDDKYNKRARERFSGPLSDFTEKKYIPEFKLEYRDDHGRELNAKEAFRQLSHKFHGKASGKKKTEKRMKKIDEDMMMMTMSSVDTPLNTVQRLREKQEREKSAFIVLSGGNKTMSGSGVVK